MITDKGWDWLLDPKWTKYWFEPGSEFYQMMKDKAVNEEKPRADEVGGKEPPNYARIFAPKEILPNGEFEAPLVMRFFNGVERVVGSGVLVQQDGAQVVTVTIGQDALEILGLKLWTVIETAPLEDTKLKFVLQKNEED